MDEVVFLIWIFDPSKSHFFLSFCPLLRNRVQEALPTAIAPSLRMTFLATNIFNNKVSICTFSPKCFLLLYVRDIDLLSIP
jgi:hypothetical protein